MKKLNRYIIALVCLIISQQLKAQSAEQYVISSAADTSIGIEDYRISFTIGEPMITAASKSYILITQGFEQPEANKAGNTALLTASLLGKTNIISWTTPFEIRGSRFIVERTRDTLNSFQPVAGANSKASNGMSMLPLSYSWNDTTFSNTTNFYRIKLISKDSVISYSNTIAMIFTEASWWLETIYPNPVKDNMQLKINSKVAANAVVTITDELGRSLFSQPIQLQKGYSTSTINIAYLPAAVYFVNIRSASHKERLVGKVIKVN